MTTTNYRGKARAVFLAAIMVISMVGMPMAFAGSAAAATTSINLSDNLVQGDDEIDISGNVDSNGTVHVFIDEDNDGNYTSATDTSGSANIENYEEDNEFSVSLNAPTDSGTYDVYVFQDEGETDSTIDEDDEGERSARFRSTPTRRPSVTKRLKTAPPSRLQMRSSSRSRTPTRASRRSRPLQW
jgi:hypothetical protein